MLHSAQEVHKESPVTAVLRLGSSPGPGPGLGIEPGSGNPGGMDDPATVGEVLPSRRSTPEGPPSGLLQVQPTDILGGLLCRQLLLTVSVVGARGE